jgi:murein L,D-transpeptidase YcbB/YkuD
MMSTMVSVRGWKVSVVGILGVGLLLGGVGCRRHRKTRSAPNTDAYAEKIQPLVQSTRLPFLKIPDVGVYEAPVQTFYDDRNDEIAWTRDGQPTAQAKAFTQAFKEADKKGLNPEDYDASRWDGRVQALASKADDAIAQYDVAMTIAVMRYVSDLRIGRLNPQHFNFDINAESKKYDLPEFVSDNAVDADDVPKLIASVEPDNEEYRATEQALAHYLDLAKQQAASGAQDLPTVAKTVSTGGSYPAIPALTARLRLEGDLDQSDTAPDDGKAAATTYTAALSDGVKNYQMRHSLTPDGKLTAATIASMNVPLSQRVLQLDASLERWRWLPNEYVNPRLMVNLPEFILRGYGEDHQQEFSMRVVVGKMVGEHETPVFTHMMKYLIFRPYWNVPVDIARKELVPHMNASKGYLAAKNFEVTDGKGQIETSYTAEQVAHGGLLVREKPGPKNSLGLVKFMFPNEYDIYLHSTPAVELFNRTRRDFSHGCIRVQHPDDLAAWVLKGQQDKDQQDWDLEKVQDAMNNGPDNHQVNLKTPLPIVIFYLTARVGEDGKVDFFDDIYKYDENMIEILKKGPPYPVEKEAPKPKTPGDTV